MDEISWQKISERLEFVLVIVICMHSGSPHLHTMVHPFFVYLMRIPSTQINVITFGEHYCFFLMWCLLLIWIVLLCPVYSCLKPMYISYHYDCLFIIVCSVPARLSIPTGFGGSEAQAVPRVCNIMKSAGKKFLFLFVFYFPCNVKSSSVIYK